ncbi:hypothetical protein [Dyella sp. 2RAB6]|uniref:hypothetical protein n=1 Tax=Dyella sp. 2RAB6 TaxID=3232992 RepID=UPI003F915053
MAIPKVWNLSPRVRLGITLFVIAYLAVTHPWTLGEPSMARGHYQVALAFLMMAVFPRGTKLYVALGVTLGAILLCGIAINAMSLA